MSTSLRVFFFDTEPPDVSSPTDYPYLIIMRHLLTVITSWPIRRPDPSGAVAKTRRKIWIFMQYSFHLNLCLFSILGLIIYVQLHQKTMTFFELGHSYISLLMCAVIFSRITTLCFSEKYRAVGTFFLEKTHLFFFKDRSEFSMETHKQVHKICHIFTLYLTAQMIAGLFLFNVTPMYNNYSSGNYAKGGLKANATYEHALYFSYPFNASTNFKWYLFANIIHWIMSYLTSTWFCVFDCFLSLMVFHVWGHFKILLNNLENFPRPSSSRNFMIEDSNATLCDEVYSAEELDRVCAQLKECIEYHRIIVKFINDMSEVFGPMLFAYYGFHQTSGCLLLLECSQMTAEALIRYLPLTIILYQQLMQLSIIFELIGSISGRLKDSVYDLPWEHMDIKNRRTVIIFLMNVQEPVHVKAMGLADVGVTSMTSILKTSMSYFTFLNSM